MLQHKILGAVLQKNSAREYRFLDPNNFIPFLIKFTRITDYNILPVYEFISFYHRQIPFLTDCRDSFRSDPILQIVLSFRLENSRRAEVSSHESASVCHRRAGNDAS